MSNPPEGVRKRQRTRSSSASTLFNFSEISNSLLAATHFLRRKQHFVVTNNSLEHNYEEEETLFTPPKKAACLQFNECSLPEPRALHHLFDESLREPHTERVECSTRPKNLSWSEFEQQLDAAEINFAQIQRRFYQKA